MERPAGSGPQAGVAGKLEPEAAALDGGLVELAMLLADRPDHAEVTDRGPLGPTISRAMSSEHSRRGSSFCFAIARSTAAAVANPDSTRISPIRFIGTRYPSCQLTRGNRDCAGAVRARVPRAWALSVLL